MSAILPVTATFNEEVQTSTIDFTLTDSSGNLVSSTFWYDLETNTVTLTPAAPLSNSMTYTATISGAENTSGVSMSGPASWSFTTAAASVVTPTVTSTSPSLNAPNVDIDTPITANFNEAVLASSITSTNFTLKNSSGIVVPATISYTDIGALHTATLTPSEPLAYSTTYTATISGVKDADGNTMSGSYSWSFATASGSSTITQLPLVYQSNLEYIGGFRVPNYYNSVSQTSYAGQGLAFDPANNSLFMAGDQQDDSILQVSIPSSIVNSSNLNNLTTVSDLQSFIQVNPLIPNYTNISDDVSASASNAYLGGLMDYNGTLIGTEYIYYDTSGNTYDTTFQLNSLTLSSSTASGMFEVGGITLGGGALQGRQGRFTMDIWLLFPPHGSPHSGSPI